MFTPKSKIRWKPTGTAWILTCLTLLSLLERNAWPGIREDFAEYETAQGFLTGHKNPTAPDGNSLLFSAEKLFVLDFHGQLEAQDVIQFRKLLNLCEVDPGRYRRTPVGEAYSQDQEAQDDYIGIVAASKLLGLTVAEEVLEYGEMHTYPIGLGIRFPYYYSINEGRGEVEPDVNAWLGRYPGVVAHMHYAADVEPGLLSRTAWGLMIWTSGRWDPENQDPWILSWLMLATRGDTTSYLARDWRQRLWNQWPNGGMGEVFGRYFNNNDHPLAKHLWRRRPGEL